MSLHRRAAKKDANQSPIVELLRKAGCSVHILNEQGAPDLLCGLRGVTFLIEVKDGSKSPSARRLTSFQEEWCRKWKGSPVYVVERLEQVGTVIDMAVNGRREAL
jgi:hypothetical protein